MNPGPLYKKNNKDPHEEMYALLRVKLNYAVCYLLSFPLHAKQTRVELERKTANARVVRQKDSRRAFSWTLTERACIVRQKYIKRA